MNTISKESYIYMCIFYNVIGFTAWAYTTSHRGVSISVMTSCQQSITGLLLQIVSRRKGHIPSEFTILLPYVASLSLSINSEVVDAFLNPNYALFFFLINWKCIMTVRSLWLNLSPHEAYISTCLPAGGAVALVALVTPTAVPPVGVVVHTLRVVVTDVGCATVLLLCLTPVTVT